MPGNVRELQHAVERAVILAPGKLLEPDNFMLRPPYSSTTGDLETLNLMELEQKAIEKAMKKCEGNISRAAEMLGITRFALYRKLENTKSDEIFPKLPSDLTLTKRIVGLPFCFVGKPIDEIALVLFALYFFRHSPVYPPYRQAATKVDRNGHAAHYGYPFFRFFVIFPSGE